MTHVCQYCRVAKTDQFIRTASGKRWKCDGCKKGRAQALKNFKGEPWTDEQRDYVLKHYGPKTAREIAVVIGRTTEAVRVFMRRYDNERLGR